MRGARWTYALIALAALFSAAVIALLVLLLLDDIERPDGVVAEIERVGGNQIRETRLSILRQLGLAGPAEDQISLSPLGETTLVTGLVDVRLSRYALTGVPHCHFNSPGALAADGNELVFGHCGGRFYRLKIDGQPEIRDTGFALPLETAALLAFASGPGTQDVTSVSVHGLLRLSNGKLAVAYTRWDAGRRCVPFSVAVVDLNAANPTALTVFEAKPCIALQLDARPIAGHQAGGRLVEIDENTLLVSVGDFEFDGFTRGTDLVQDPATDLGKTILIRLDTGEHRVFSLGHRNPQGLTRLRDGRILLTEHGPRGGDEVNLIEEGQNYGWPRVSLGVRYGWEDLPASKERGRHGEFRPPLFAYMPSIGISQLTDATGFAKEWAGDVLVGSLTGKTLRRLRLEGGRVLYDEPIRLGHRLRDIVQLADGRIAMLTDGYEILVLDASQSGGAQNIAASAPAAVQRVFTQCLECHVVNGAGAEPGRIPLAGLIGRPVAGWPGVDYSTGLKAVAGAWTRETLDVFLTDPDKFAPGTAMAGRGISDAALRGQLIDLLVSLPAAD
jgi:glucose/arabinose dehydrogenase/cytochrome c2